MTLLQRPWLAVLLLAAVARIAPAGAEEPRIVLQNDHYLVEVSSAHGLITRVYDKGGRLELLQGPGLADNFKFSLPLPGKAAWQATEANYVLGKDQRLSSHQASDSRLVLHWDGPLSSVTGGSYDVSAVMTIELVGEDIHFGLTIKNPSRLEIGEVYYPILGGSLGLGQESDVRKRTELVLPGTAQLRKVNVFHTFVNAYWLGVIGAEQSYSYPDGLCMPWMALDHPGLGRGVYIGAHDPVARFKVIHLELLPGIAPSRAGGNWPRPDELKGLPVGVKMCLVHFPYQPPGKDFEASPVVVRFYDGDWHQGAKAYGDWLASHYDLQKPRADWQYRTQAFQQCGPVPFRDLPQWAKQGAAAGVKGLLLTQWKIGGSDNGAPRFEPDPRLGSREELAEAIRHAHALGVKVALVVNLPPASQLDEAYRNELHNYACTDRWGIVYSILGWPEGDSVTGGFGRGQRRVWLNPGNPGMRKYLVAQLRELAALGIDGVCLQDFFARQLDFNATVGRTADRASWEGGIECVGEILEACRTVNPEFSVSVDTLWDHLLPITQTCGLPSRDGCPLPAVFGFVQPTFTLTDANSLGAVNDSLLYRGRLRIAPANGQPMCGSALGPAAEYLKAVLAIREALAHTLLEGECLGAQGLRVEGPVTFSTFRNRTTGLRTAVIVGGGGEAIDAELGGFVEQTGTGPASGTRAAFLWQPGQEPRKLDFPSRIHIPSRQLAVITEEQVVGVTRKQSAKGD